MALQLYRRHRKECEGGRPEDFKSGTLEEGRRGWKKCNCLIHISGSIAGKFGRRSTGERDWEKAHAVAAGWVKAKSWAPDESPAEPEPVPAPDPLPARTTINATIDAYLDRYKSRDIQGSTLAKYRTLTNQLGAYCTEEGYAYIDQLCVRDMDRFYASWKDGKKGKAKKLERLKAFVRFCLKRKWLTPPYTTGCGLTSVANGAGSVCTAC